MPSKRVSQLSLKGPSRDRPEDRDAREGLTRRGHLFENGSSCPERLADATKRGDQTDNACPRRDGKRPYNGYRQTPGKPTLHIRDGPGVGVSYVMHVHHLGHWLATYRDARCSFDNESLTADCNKLPQNLLQSEEIINSGLLDIFFINLVFSRHFRRFRATCPHRTFAEAGHPNAESCRGRRRLARSD